MLYVENVELVLYFYKYGLVGFLQKMRQSQSLVFGSVKI